MPKGVAFLQELDYKSFKTYSKCNNEDFSEIAYAERKCILQNKKEHEAKRGCGFVEHKNFIQNLLEFLVRFVSRQNEQIMDYDLHHL